MDPVMRAFLDRLVANKGPVESGLLLRLVICRALRFAGVSRGGLRKLIAELAEEFKVAGYGPVDKLSKTDAPATVVTRPEAPVLLQRCQSQRAAKSPP
jgi:hypothetical protein